MLRPGNAVGSRFRQWLLATATLAVGCFCGAVVPDKTQADETGIAFFETSIRPLLVERCYACHGAEEQESDLRLDSFDAIMAGGASGAAIVPGQPGQSLLLTAVSYDDPALQMPPDARLSQREVASLRRWIEMGAPHPDADGTRPLATSGVDLAAGREFWAFQPPRRADLPVVHDATWATSPVDLFVLARLEQHGLTPVEPIDRRTLIRRATLDLLGLPPTPEEVAAFVDDPSPNAFATVVDRLLASPRYGERWGRHWLDVARFADSNGLDENIAHGNAWRYRDYVVAAFNRDMPFDQFVLEQLAGDLLPSPAGSETDDATSVAAGSAAATSADDASGADDELRRRRLIATGFLSLGPKVLAEVDEQKMEMDIVDEQVSTLGRAVLGLTLGCARCHDHKFDPIATRDYYALAGIFKSTRTMDSFTKIASWHENEIATPEERAAKSAHDAQVARCKAEIEQTVARATDELQESLDAGAALPENPADHFPEATKQELAALRTELAELEKAAPLLPTAMGVVDGEPADTAIHVRGSHLTLGESVPRGAPAVLVAGQPLQLPSDHSGRLALARWLTTPDHALTSRVIVNRIWRWHFGNGLVATPDNFGRLGERPTHPELLDWLATRLVDSGWSIKELHRLILLSSTYQLSSRLDAERSAIDPENRWFWRANLRRLEAEAIRDSLLAVSGRLDLSMGGSLLHVGNREFLFNHTSKDETKYDSRRRSVYLPVVRNHLYDLFQLFDYADASVPNGDRPTSTVATQALFMMNGQLVLEAADGLAEQIVAIQGDRARIERLNLTVFGRPPSDPDAARMLEYVQRVERFLSDVDVPPDAADPVAAPAGNRREWMAWSSLCQALLASNEFVCIP